MVIKIILILLPVDVFSTQYLPLQDELMIVDRAYF